MLELPAAWRLTDGAGGTLAVRGIDVDDLVAIRQHRPLSDSELIDQAIAFANSGDTGAWTRVMTGVSLPETGVSGTSAMDAERTVLREIMTVIATGRTTLALRDSLRRRADGLLLLPSRQTDGTVRYRYLIFEIFDPLSPFPPFALAAWLLLGQSLCQCKYDQCRNFFRPTNRYGKRGGRAATVYCPGTDHHDLAAAQRRKPRKHK